MATTQNTRQFRFQACQHCNGDAYVDFSEYEPEWRCLQCSRTVQPAATVMLFDEAQVQLAA